MKHAQCFDKALMKDGSIVFASKDYRLYIYRYVKVNYSVKCGHQIQDRKPSRFVKAKLSWIKL